MCPSYFRIQIPLVEAMDRYRSFDERPEQDPPQMVDYFQAVDLACDSHGNWRGSALFIYEIEGWTMFEDLSGHHSWMEAGDWLPFAQDNPFVFAAYNDAIGYGELIVIENGTIVREFQYDADDIESLSDKGTLPNSAYEPLKSWVQVASFVDDDDLYDPPDRGLLWIH